MSARALLSASLFVSLLMAVLHGPVVARETKTSPAIDSLLKKDPMEILRACMAKCETLDQFTQVFTKKERIGGELRETETTFVKYRAKPLSIYMKWIAEPHKGREAIYVEGKNDNKAVLHEYVGPLNVLVKSDPEGPEVKKRSRRPLTQAGVRNATKALVDLTELAKKRGDMRLTVLGTEKVNGRDTVVLCRLLEKRDDYCVYMTVIYIDPEYMLPVKVAGYDWDHTLSWLYQSRDVNTNVKLTDEDFNYKNPNYQYPALVGIKLWPFGGND